MKHLGFSLITCGVYGLFSAIIAARGEELDISSFLWMMFTIFFAGWGIPDAFDTLLSDKEDR